MKAFEALQETVMITPVSQFSDVQFTDWAFVALQSLVEKYSCITGYPDKTFKGNQILTRYEFAAGLSTCISTINQQFGSQLSKTAPEDVTTIKKLQYEFATELAALENRVENLEVNSAVLRSQQFSTTTRLSGSFVAVASGITGDSADGDRETNINSNLALNYRARLNLITSFTGQDRLLVRLQSANRVPNFNGASATNMTRQSFEVGNSDSSMNLNLLEYRFPVAENLNFYIYGNAASHHYYATVVNPDFASFGGAKGSPSRFSERNPIYRIGFISPAGVAAVYNNKTIRLDVGYLAENAETGNEGLFGGNYSALAQLSFKPSPNTEFGLAYVRSYVPDGNLLHRTGSNFANIPFGTGVPLIVNAYGVQALWRITPKIAVSSWVGYMNAERVDGVNGNANIINYAVNLAFPDLFTEKAVGGIGFGMPPKVMTNTINNREDKVTGLHFEAFYQYPLTENITVIPGIIYLTQPNHNDVNGDILFGSIRTVFSF
ncbi:iron uptake porin [Nostoc edaphicum CCNP1411]|uniref:Iron uptake porin n=1 Tax=Nostoc edaphicum CCNP1411 TaxID=1472755 RepID=A0A7D7LG07_9NOSO|nr:iron uptake porin [Nostoc edaphicum]QMS92318.1 iron uptake porin [Nostoc edaphicum CCNP1411]